MAKYQNLGKDFVSGDFRSETGSNCDYILYDHYLEAGLDDSIRYNDMPVRASKVHVTDAYGRRLLEVCKTTKLLIANGRLGLDKGIGDFTFCGEKGCSVVDYLLVLLIDFETISSFEICEFTEFSDHAGIAFGLNCKPRSNSSNDSVPERTYSRKLNWNNDKIEDFRNSISNLSSLFQSLSLSLEQDNSEDNINDFLGKFPSSIYSCSDNHFGKHVCTENYSTPIKKKQVVQRGVSFS